MAYASKYYDPRKAHEYYMRHRKLKGRRSTAGLNETGKAAALSVKTRLNEEKKAAVEKYKAGIKKQADALRAKIRKANGKGKDALKSELAALREAAKEGREKIKAQYDDRYAAELLRMKGDAGMRTGGTSTAGLSDKAKAQALKQKETITAQRKADLDKAKETQRAKIAGLRAALKNMDTEQRAAMRQSVVAQIEDIRKAYGATKDKIKAKYDGMYTAALEKIRRSRKSWE